MGSRLRFPEITSFDVSVMCAYADFLLRAMINETSRLLLRSRVCLSLLSIKRSHSLQTRYLNDVKTSGSSTLPDIKAS